jgi:hypothetical protein
MATGLVKEMRTGAKFTVAKEWDGNEAVTERGNRTYVSAGRWRWVVLIDGVVDGDYDLKREAVARVRFLEEHLGRRK